MSELFDGLDSAFPSGSGLPAGPLDAETLPVTVPEQQPDFTETPDAPPASQEAAEEEGQVTPAAQVYSDARRSMFGQVKG